MNACRLLLTSLLLAGLSARLVAQSSPNLPLSRKPLNEQLTIIPFVWEFDSFRFKPHDKDVPDELRAEVSGKQLRIWGTKKNDTKTIMGRVTGSFGKVALFPPQPRSGTLAAKVQSIKGVNRYGIALDLANGSLKSTATWLEPNTDYVWKSSVKDGQFVVELTAPGQPEFSVSADAASVRSFGFFATVRYPASKAEMLVTFGEANTELETPPKTSPVASPVTKPVTSPVPAPAPTPKPASPASNSIERLFVGRTWLTAGGTSFTFLKDGTGFRQYKSDKAAFTWQVRDRGYIETTGEVPTEGRTQTLYFQFVNAGEAYYGGSSEAIKQKLTPKG